MRPDIANRIVFALACAGAAVALITGLFHLFETSLPCGDVQQGALSGCDQVAKDSWAHIFGIPTAFYGLSLYLLVAVLAAVREYAGFSETKRLGSVIWALLAAGTVTSFVLLAHATIEIKALCNWCWASGIIMFVAMIGQTAGQIKSGAPTRGRWPLAAYAVFGVVIIGAAGAWGYAQAMAGRGALTELVPIEPPSDVQLIRETNPSLGPEDAPITVVEFSDLHCPSCSENHIVMKRLMAGPLEGQIRLVFRHYPLLRPHPNSGTAAVLAEWAHDRGKFWEFVDLMMFNQDKSNLEGMLELLSQLDFEPNEVRPIIADDVQRRPYSERVQQDRLDAFKLDVQVTPTWFVIYPDGTILKSTGPGIETLLSDAELEKRGYKGR